MASSLESRALQRGRQRALDKVAFCAGPDADGRRAGRERERPAAPQRRVRPRKGGDFVPSPEGPPPPAGGHKGFAGRGSGLSTRRGMKAGRWPGCSPAGDGPRQERRGPRASDAGVQPMCLPPRSQKQKQEKL